VTFRVEPRMGEQAEGSDSVVELDAVDPLAIDAVGAITARAVERRCIGWLLACTKVRPFESWPDLRGGMG